MFTRSIFKTPGMPMQSKRLTDVGKLVDEGKVKTTMNQAAGKIDAANLKGSPRAGQ
jgi:hypothetical protein